MKTPNFIIVGSLKAGTSMLASALSKHPEIGVPKEKELHFFNSRNPTESDWYEKKLAESGKPIVGEATPAYSYAPHVPKHIFERYPNTKIIWILRDPVARAYSNYIHARNSHIEKRSFNKAIEDELSGVETNYFRMYCNRSRYVDQLQRYLVYFRMEQMKVLILEEFVQDFPGHYQSLLEFLEVNNQSFIPGREAERVNATRISKASRLKSILFRVPGFSKLPISVKNLWPKAAPDEFSDRELQAMLSDYFLEANNSLESMLRRPIGCWSSYQSRMNPRLGAGLTP